MEFIEISQVYDIGYGFSATKTKSVNKERITFFERIDENFAYLAVSGEKKMITGNF